MKTATGCAPGGDANASYGILPNSSAENAVSVSMRLGGCLMLRIPYSVKFPGTTNVAMTASFEKYCVYMRPPPFIQSPGRRAKAARLLR